MIIIYNFYISIVLVSDIGTSRHNQIVVFVRVFIQCIIIYLNGRIFYGHFYTENSKFENP